MNPHATQTHPHPHTEAGPDRGRRPGGPSPARTAGFTALAVAALVAGCAPRTEPPVVPYPAAVERMGEGSLVLDSTTAIAWTGGGDAGERVAHVLSAAIGTLPETRPAVLPASDPAAAGAVVRLAIDEATVDAHGPEGYALRITTEGVRLEAATPAGLFYGVQTLRQLLPPRAEFEGARPGPMTVPLLAITDRPRFGWRGAMLDVSRHFFEPDDVKRYIDLLALHKLNRLHLHLADDQGWRIEVPGRPRLTEHGASTEVGGGPGGFYTTADYEELVRYAADRFITIVPEIDMPGHTNAALASIPELNCDGEAPPLYTGIEVGFSALCVHDPATYAFVDDVIGHLAAITPGPWIHIGGDEVEELTDEEYQRFIERVEDIVHSHGKQMVGWQEVAAADIHPSTLIQHWHGEGDELQGASAGQVILSPATRIYVDMKYHDRLPIGLDWSGLTPLRDSYDWDPAAFIPGLPASAIAGIEAPLWTETVASMDDIELMAFPRLAAVAELAWTDPSRLDWPGFRRRLARLGLRWTALGINFYRTPEVDWADW